MFPWMVRETSGCSNLEQEEQNELVDISVKGVSGAESIDLWMNELPGNQALRHFMAQISATPDLGRWIELPMICVCGDTSSGKSSLLSQLSTVEFPSDKTLTTRCPILLKMKKSPTRRATIRIQWTSAASNSWPDFPERIIQEDRWETIPQSLREAQKHILECTKKDVSADIICLDLQAPYCQDDLTLLDLPGLVRTRAEDESDTLPTEVQALLDQYLVNERCVILAVVPAQVDFHNSQIMADALRLDPTTERTIPVITKPDLIDKGAEEQVLELLLGKKVHFSMGFHMIKGRGQAALDRGDTVDQALKDEEVFFEQTEPWRSLEDKKFLGTPNLRRKLGSLQMNMIRKSTPIILKEVKERQQAASRKLQKMGEMHTTPLERRRYYHDVCRTLVSQLKSTLSGKGKRTKKPSAAACLNDACTEFTARIQEGSLATVRAIVEGAQVIVASPRGNVRGQVVHLDEKFACVDFVEVADKASEVLFDAFGIKSTEPVEEDDVWSDCDKVFIARSNNMIDILRKIPLTTIRTDPTWLKLKISNNRTDDLACFLNVEIFKNIVEEFIEEDWRPHCMTLLERTNHIVLSALGDAIAMTMTTQRYPELRTLVERQCRDSAKHLLIRATEQIETHLEIEKHPYTQDHILFKNIADARYRSLRRELEIALRLDQTAVFDTQTLKATLDDVFERNQRQSVEDHLAEEMEIVLESYGQIATRRVIDRTPMVCWEVFRSIAALIEESLSHLTDEKLLECMKETPDFAASYAKLVDEYESMTRALEIFESLT